MKGQFGNAANLSAVINAPRIFPPRAFLSVAQQMPAADMVMVAFPVTVEALRRRHTDRRAYFVAACEDINQGDRTGDSTNLQLQFLDAERASIAALYSKGGLDDESRRRIE